MTDTPGADVEDVTEERKNFLDSLVRNKDGSITVERQGKITTFPAEHFFYKEPPIEGIPHDLNEYVGRIASEMGFNPGDDVRYSITVLPRDSE